MPLTLSLLALALLAVPLAIIIWLLRFPGSAPDATISFEHLIVVANVSLLALLVAVFVTRSALEQKAYRVLFVGLGFLSMAGFFTVHALATPGVLLQGPDVPVAGAYGGYSAAGTYHNQHGADAVLGISAYLSLLIPALFFAARYLPLDWRPSQRLRLLSRVIAAAVAIMLVGYGTLGLTAPDTLAELPLLQSPFVYMAAGISVALLLFSAWCQGREFLAGRLPMQAAQAAVFLLLADAQVAMSISPVWGPAWWGYHVLMLIAVVAALFALFIELDRRRGFERFLSPAVVERVMSGESISMGGHRQVVTILFADLRNSTALAEKLPAEGVVSVLNSYVGAMAQCVFDHGGVLDKFLGDGLMAIFGVPADASRGAANAIAAAQAMHETVAALNGQRTAAGGEPINFGVGIHTGEVVLGAVGLPQRSDYTAIGDTVNTASRLESLCKEYHVSSVVSADSVTMLDGQATDLKLLGTTAIRGKEHEVQVFTLV